MKNDNRIIKSRESGLELLRIIAMLFVVFHHCMLFSPGIENIGVDSTIINVLKAGGKLGVNIFVFISAYFLVEKSFKLKRIVNVVFHTIFYSLCIYLIFVSSNLVEFSNKGFFNSLLPTLFQQYWFVSAYVLLLIMSPVLNAFIEKITKKQHATIMILLGSIIILFPYINFKIGNEHIEVPFFNELMWFSEIYFLAGFIKKHKISVGKLKAVILLMVCISIKVLATIVSPDREIYMVNSIGNFSLAFAFFILFKEIHFKNKVVNFIASLTFGVFLIHEHPQMREWWWSTSMQKGVELMGNTLAICFVNTLITFVICAFIELIRKLTIQVLINKGVSKITQNIRKGR